MNKATTRILIIIIVLALAALACVGGGGDGVDKAGSNDSSSLVNQSDVHSPEATATFGAQELHIQLTEIARQTNK